MSISLNKKTGINLSKGSSISLVKDEKIIEKVCIGLNWGAIQRKTLFGLLTQSEAVDLDVSLTAFNAEKQPVYTVYYKNLSSFDQAIKHSGDDRIGDDADDDADNEVITIDLKKIDPSVEQIVLYLNSFERQDFGEIPYTKIRIYEGTPTQVNEIFATFNLSVDAAFKGNISMIMGKLVRTKNNWDFQTIGEPIREFGVNATIDVIKQKYL